MTTTVECSLKVRWAEATDYAQLADLHRMCFPTENWTRDDFVKFQSNCKRNNVLKSLVDERNRVYGSLLYTLEPQACCIRRIAVHADHRRCGYATMLLNTLCGRRSTIKRRLFSAYVREDNLPATLLMQQVNFTFDPKKTRRRDEENNVDYYEFTYEKVGVPVVTVRDE